MDTDKFRIKHVTIGEEGSAAATHLSRKWGQLDIGMSVVAGTDE